MREKGTYVYCLVAAPRQPALPRVPAGLPRTGRVRLLPVVRGQWLVVSDAPLDAYSEGLINKRLSDLDWVSRAAIAHERVVESFLDATALLPMKLFTIFSSDERAVADIRRRQGAVDATLKRVKNRSEWGVRVMFDRTRPAAGRSGRRRRGTTGAEYLSQKKAQRDAAAGLADRAREVVSHLYDRLAKESSAARRRAASDMPAQGGPMLLDAALLVPRTRTERLRTLVARESRRLDPEGFRVTLSGPWPPYSFMQE